MPILICTTLKCNLKFMVSQVAAQLYQETLKILIILWALIQAITNRYLTVQALYILNKVHRIKIRIKVKIKINSNLNNYIK
jgi:methylglyoxal synthase